MKKILSGILASTLILSAMGASFALEVPQSEDLQAVEVETLTSGTCGENATYSFDESTGTLTISGTGEMEDYSSSPWSVFDGIKSVVIAEGITSIGNFAFANCSLTSVTIGNSVTSVGDYAFRACNSLTSVIIPNSVTSIGLLAFSECNALTDVYYGGSVGDRAKITMAGDNDPLLDATWHYNSGSGTPEPELTIPSWAETFISYALDSGILPDISANNMDSASNRGLIAQALYNLAGEGANVSASHSFNDTGDYAQAIAWCYDNDLMTGMGETEFGTNSNVTREQFALILRALANYQGKDVSGDTSVLSQFSDQSAMNDWAKEGIAWAVNAGLMQGNEGILDPQGAVTQVQVAVMMENFGKM